MGRHERINTVGAVVLVCAFGYRVAVGFVDALAAGPGVQGWRPWVLGGSLCLVAAVFAWGVRHRRERSSVFLPAMYLSLAVPGVIAEFAMGEASRAVVALFAVPVTGAFLLEPRMRAWVDGVTSSPGGEGTGGHR
jgi:hypothetical protein